MAEFESLEELLLHLQCAEPLPSKEGESWGDTMLRIGVPGRVAEIDEHTYDWFFYCLPPKWQGAGFAFTEGAEPLKYFWVKEGFFFCRQLTWGETKEFCRLAEIELPCYPRTEKGVSEC